MPVVTWCRDDVDITTSILPHRTSLHTVLTISSSVSFPDSGYVPASPRLGSDSWRPTFPFPSLEVRTIVFLGEYFQLMAMLPTLLILVMMC